MDSLLYFFRHQRVLPSVESNSPPTGSKAGKNAPEGETAAGSPSSDSSSPSAASAASMAISGMSDTPSPPQQVFRIIDGAESYNNDRTPSGKRKGGPLESGRTAAVVAKRWKALNKEMDRAGPEQLAARMIKQPVSISARVNGAKSADSVGNGSGNTNGGWTSRLNPLNLVQPAKVKEEDMGDGPARNPSGLHQIPSGPPSAVDSKHETGSEPSRIVVARSEYNLRQMQREQELIDSEIPDSQETAITEVATEVADEDMMLDDEDQDQGHDDVHRDGDDEEDTEEDEDDSGWYEPQLSTRAYPNPGLPQQVQSFKASNLDNSAGHRAADSDDYDSDDLETEDEDDGVDENWDWLFEAEPIDSDGRGAVPDEKDYYWSVDVDERTAYEQGVAAIDGYDTEWTADEKRLHRLLSLRGFHPLLPATWTRDFLGVPMYPSLFAAAQANSDPESTPPVTITNYGSQFHATKALRALFDLQSRVSGLRQTGHNTVRIGAIIERELRRYIAWAAADAGLDKCAPLAAMPNIAAKQFLVNRQQHSTPNKKGKKTKKRSIARQVQDFFGDWVARYRAYYAALPEYDVEGKAGGKQRLRPPRLLYGFVIVQHAVMLLVVDAAGNRSSRHPRPRCLADFNLSLGDRWLDASLSVAIPVHVARAAQLRCREGLKLPTTAVEDADEDA